MTSLSVSMTTVVLTAGLIAATSAAYADVPTAENFAACNGEARDAVTGGNASPPTSPTAKDRAQAGEKWRGESAGRETTDPTGKIIESKDPQIEGMDATGAKDPAYRAAYRSCMRRNGF